MKNEEFELPANTRKREREGRTQKEKKERKNLPSTDTNICLAASKI